MKFPVEPIECGADIVHLPTRMVVVALAQPGAAKVEAQHWKTKAVQRLHGVKDDLVMEGAAEQGVGMANQRRVRGLVGASVEQGFEPPARTV